MRVVYGHDLSTTRRSHFGTIRLVCRKRGRVEAIHARAPDVECHDIQRSCLCRDRQMVIARFRRTALPDEAVRMIQTGNSAGLENA